MSEETRIPTQAEIDAEIEVKKAEAFKARAEAKKAEAEAAFSAEQARLEKAKADMEEMSLEISGFDLERHRELRARELTCDGYHHTYYFSGQVNKESVGKCMSELTYWMRDSRHEGAPIEIIFNSPGGSVIDGMALYDYIRQCSNAGHKITTSCIGYAASMGGILLQAGDHRVMGDQSYILIHEVSFGAGGKIGEVEDEVKFVKMIQSRVLDIFAARSKLSKRQLQTRWERKDWWLDSTQAKKYGFVDEVRGECSWSSPEKCADEEVSDEG